MKRKSIVVAASVVTLLFFASMGFCGAIDGEYGFNKKGQSGSLVVKSQGANKVKFSFSNSNSRGNSGELEFVTIVDAAGNAQYSSKDEFDDCQIKLNVKGKVIKVKQIKGACGAGNGVYFEGSYKNIK